MGGAIILKNLAQKAAGRGFFAIISALALSAALAACADDAGNDPQSAAPSYSVSSSAESRPSESEVPDSSQEDSSFDDPASDAAFDWQNAYTEFVRADGLSENYADLENRSFVYQGKLYTLGKNTLQDLIDGGIPFSPKDLNNSGNNVNPNYESSTYTVEINHYATLQFIFVNVTETKLTEADCLLSTVRWYPLYVPHDNYGESLNREIVSGLNDAAEHVCFSFPLTLTKEQLLENNRNATDIDEYNNVEYKTDSQIYMASSGYRFEFDRITNQLDRVSISWVP